MSEPTELRGNKYVMKWCGIWSVILRYQIGDVVYYHGHMFIAIVDEPTMGISPEVSEDALNLNWCGIS